MREHPDDPPRIAVVDLERLYTVEGEFSDATSLAVIAVDARGVPVTNHCGFSDFCLEIRKDPIRRMRCYSCDAHGGLQAAIEGRPHIYRCHTGLIDFSVPIIIDDQYVGAILCGQVKIDQRADDPDFLLGHDQSWRQDTHLRDLFDAVPRINIRKVQAAAGTLQTLTQDMVHQATSRVIVPLRPPAPPAPREAGADHLTRLHRHLEQDDLPGAVAATTAYLDGLAAGQGRYIDPQALTGLHDTITAAAKAYGPATARSIADAIERRRRRAPLNRYSCQVYAESLLHILYDAAGRGHPGRRHTVASLRSLIERYPTRTWTLKDVADYLGVSESHASKSFKAHTGQTFVSYIAAKRLERAKLMVAYTDTPIQRVARELGFLPNYFSRVFKAATGLTPGDYRRKYAPA